MIGKIKSSIRSAVHRASLRNIWTSLRFYWLSDDRSNVIFAASIVLAMTLIGLTIQLTIDSQDKTREVNCLALNVYHEARGEPDKGKYAVAKVTLNRVASRHYPTTICEVVYQQGWDYIRKRYVSAFSWTELDERPATTNNRAWQKALQIATEVYENPDSQDLKGALFYHAKHIRPSWARKKIKVARIGRHIFYQ